MGHINITNRPEFAAYLNMALHNCYMALNHIIKVSGGNGNFLRQQNKKGGGTEFVEIPIDQENMKDALILDPDRIPVESEKIEKLKDLFLQQYPMLDPFIKKENEVIIQEEISKRANRQNSNLDKSQLYPYTLQDIVICLKKVFTVLTYYRDMASHTIFNDERNESEDYSNTERAVAYMLHFTMTVACRIVKVRFALKDDDQKRNELDFFLKNKYDKRFFNTKVDGKPAALLNTGFSHSIFKNDGKKDGKPITRNLSENGLVYLICMFLERKYAKMFIDKLDKSFYNICYDSEYVNKERVGRNKKWLFEIYTTYRIQLPRTKIDSKKNDLANALDMLNELKKCPAELFGVLSNEDQEKFAVTADTGERVLLRRYGDRFSQMALRWIDDRNIFETLRFHVKFGKYHYVFCDEKHCVDGISRVRTIVKNLNGFGRLHEVEARRRGAENVWMEQAGIWNGTQLVRSSQLIPDEDDELKPYITDFNTQYIIDGNKIGLYDGNYMPDISGNNHIENKTPHYWLSLYDLPGLTFYAYLYGKLNEEDKKSGKFEKPQDIILGYRKRYLKLFEDFHKDGLASVGKMGSVEEMKNFLLKHYQLGWGEIPDKVKDSITGTQRRDFVKSANAELIREMESTRKRKERFKVNIKAYAANKGKDNKMGKKQYVDIKPGRLAEFLAHDIVKYQPYTNPSDKPTGLNFRVMQAALATFANAEDLDMIIRTFVSLRLIRNDMAHPFLEKVLELNPVNMIDLYINYLVIKEQYLSNHYDEDSQTFDLDFISKTPFLNSNRSKWMEMNESNRKSLAERYKSMPILLPTGLFEVSIKKILLHLHYAETHELLEKDSVCNTSFMIQQYMRLVKKDDVQKFYYYDRVGYDLFMDMGRSFTEKELKQNMTSAISRRAKEKWNSKKPWEQNNWIRSHKGTYFSDVFKLRIERGIKEFKANEKMIRRYQIEDIVLLLLAQDILFGQNISTQHCQLKDITPTGDKGILSENIPNVDFAFNFPVSVLDENTSTKKKKNYIEIVYSILIRYKDIKIKDWGKMTSLLYDWRIQNPKNSILLQMASEEQLNNLKLEYDYELIAKELENYDSNRVGLFEDVLQFESDIVDIIRNDPEKRDSLSQGKIDFKKILQTFNGTDSKESFCISQVRNSVCHNQYPKLKEIGVEDVDLPKVVTKLKAVLEENADRLKAGNVTSK